MRHAVGTMDDDLPWNRSEPIAKPPRTTQSLVWGRIALVAAAITFLLESWLWVGGLEAQHQIKLLPPAVLITIALCVVAGFCGARTHGVIGGLLILLPGLVLFIIVLSASISNSFG